MKKLEQFLEKKKMDHKFNKAGSGVKLTETKSQPSSSEQMNRPFTPRAAPSGSAQMAGQAALSRLEPKSSAASKAQARAERDSQLARQSQDASSSRQTQGGATGGARFCDGQAPVSVSGVYFRCRCSQRISKTGLESHLQECLLVQLAEDPTSAAATMVYTLNKDREKVKTCVDTIAKYIENVCNNPGDEKYQRIRANNKAFQDRVSAVAGAEEFLQAVGFERRILPYQDSETDFFVLSPEAAANTDLLTAWKEMFKSGAPFKPVLDRDMKVYQQSSRAGHFQLPNEFYSLMPEEIKREQQLRSDAVERNAVLRTKAMKEAESQKALRRYRYALVRIRFPDGVLLQGTFHARDKLLALKEFVRSQLDNGWQPFILTDPANIKLTDDDAMLAELRLAPAAVVNFSWDAEVMADIAACQGGVQVTYLKPDAMARIQIL